MITRIKTENFQGHKKRVIDLDRITTIVGRNDKGKSTNIRALRWVSRNHLRTTSFIRRGAKRASVKIFVDGHKIGRQRSGRNNLYTLGSKKFKAFGNKVPEEIANVLRMDDLNFHRQLDPPFWFDLSGPQLSKELNAVINLELIDRSLAEAASSVRAARADVEASSKRLKEAREDRKGMDWTKDLDGDIHHLEEKDLEIAALEAKAEALESLIEEIEEKQAEENVRIPSLKRLEALRSRILEKEAECDQLSQLLDSLEEEKEKLAWARNEEKQARRKLKAGLKGRCPVCGNSMPSITS